MSEGQSAENRDAERIEAAVRKPAGEMSSRRRRRSGKTDEPPDERMIVIRHRVDRAVDARTTAAARVRIRIVVRFVVATGVDTVIVLGGLIAPAVLRSYDLDLDHRPMLRCHLRSDRKG